MTACFSSSNTDAEAKFDLDRAWMLVLLLSNCFSSIEIHMSAQKQKCMGRKDMPHLIYFSTA